MYSLSFESLFAICYKSLPNKKKKKKVDIGGILIYFSYFWILNDDIEDISNFYKLLIS